MRKVAVFLSAAAVGVAAWACSDAREPTNVEVDPTNAISAAPSAGCNVRDLVSAARSYFGTQAQRQQVIDKLNLIAGGTGCQDEGDAKAAWEALKILEDVLWLGTGGSASDAETLTEGLINRIIAPTADSTFNVHQAVFGPGGGFGVRGVLANSAPPIDSTAPVLSRGAVQLTFAADSGGASLTPPPLAIVGVRPHQDAAQVGVENWRTLAVGGITLITSYPVGSAPHSAFELNEAPNVGFQSGQQADVYICFVGDVHPPHPGSELLAANFSVAVKKNGNLILQDVGDAESFCDTYAPVAAGASLAAQQKSPLSALVRLASNVIMPEPLGAAMFFHTDMISGEGGGTFFFSQFGVSNALKHGKLEFVKGWEPPKTPTANQPFEVRVRASSGNASVEFMNIHLFIFNNNGVPGQLVGAFTACGGGAPTPPTLPTGCTMEPDGVASITVSVTSPGAYIMVATASDPNDPDEFVFADARSARFNVRP